MGILLETIQNEFYELMKLHEKGKVKMHTTTYPLKDANRVLQMLDEGKVNGYAVLVPRVL